MCGIVSIFSRSIPVEKTAIERAINTLNHRGPDGKGIWISNRQEIGLGHSRLSIIDLEKGAQPLSNENNQVHAVVNGEFYNYEKIREDLEKAGHHFCSRCDSEILVHLYEEYDVECLHYLRGEFAFILWDQRKGRLFAGRDRFGIKPLCYLKTKDSLYIASEAKAIFSAGANPQWDDYAFYHAASLHYTPPDRTLFKGIYQLQPGHYFLAKNTSVKTYKYWDLNYGSSDLILPQKSESEYIREFESLLRESVKIRLRADVPICCHLSGGIDSSSVLSLATQESDQAIECFTVSFEKDNYNEFDIAKEMSTHLNVTLNPVYVTQEDIVNHLSQATYYSEGLAINGHITAKMLLNQAIRKAGFKVALTGEGADELLAGYPHLRNDLFLYSKEYKQDSTHLLHKLFKSNQISAGVLLEHGNALSTKRLGKILGFVQSFIKAKATLGYRFHEMLSEDFKYRFRKHDCFGNLLKHFDLETQLTHRHCVNQSLYLWTKLALANYILRILGDGMEMSQSVEGRVPFLDHNVFEFVKNLPMSFKIRGTMEKYILRETMRPYITKTLYNRHKHPFMAPPISVFSNSAMNTLIQDSIRSESFKSLPFFNTRKVLTVLNALPHMNNNDRTAMEPILMMILTSHMLHKHFRLSG